MELDFEASYSTAMYHFARSHTYNNAMKVPASMLPHAQHRSNQSLWVHVSGIG